MEPRLHGPIRYLTFGREVCPETARHHLQGYLQLTSRARFSTVQGLLPAGAHIEPARGSAEENNEYCHKEGDFEVFGICQLSANETRKRSREETCRDIFEDHKAKRSKRDILEDYPHYWKDVVGLSIARHSDRSAAPQVLYLYGATGTGKSYNTQRALEDLSISHYFKPSGIKWWPDYDQQSVAVIEEFSSCFTCSQFLQLCDRAPYSVEFKGGHTPFNSQGIIILSNIEPDEQYKGAKDEKFQQWRAYRRRIEHAVKIENMDYDDIYTIVAFFLLGLPCVSIR